MWRRIVALMRKEFLAILKDKRVGLVLIGPPIIQLLVFGYAATYDLNQVPFAVYNEDQGEASRDLLAKLRLSPTFHEVAKITHDAEIAPLIDSRKALLMIHLGPDFSRNLANGIPAQLQVIVDGRNSNTAMIALNYIQSIVDAFSREWTAEQRLEAPRAHLVIRAWFNPNLESRWFIVPGIIGLLTLVVTMLVTALSVAREREQGTFDQLSSHRCDPGDRPWKSSTRLYHRFCRGDANHRGRGLLVSRSFTRESGDPLHGAVSFSSLGDWSGTDDLLHFRDATARIARRLLFLVPSIILSGFTTPIANMPQTVQYLTYINPLRYFMVVLRAVFLRALLVCPC